jgi:nucleoside-diphosphate-sugar epimerase
MRVVVTGARGKVGRAVVAAMQGAGHEVTEVDLVAPVFEAALPGEPGYLRADLTDAGEAFAVVRGAEAVVHAAAIPDPLHHPPQVVFHNNVMSVFNVLEAAVRLGVRRFVNISSETVPGFFFPERAFLPDYLPVDELHPIRPQDPYAIGKHVSELLMDAAVRRSDLRCISIRPSWVQHAGNIERNLGPIVRERRIEAPNFGCYVHADDLAEAIRLAAESDLPGHEVFYAAAADNAAGLPLGEAVRARYGDRIELRLDGLAREDASAISCAKAERLLGWRPKRSWRDHLDAEGRASA